jgi:hypothetical protein
LLSAAMRLHEQRRGGERHDGGSSFL